MLLSHRVLGALRGVILAEELVRQRGTIFHAQLLDKWVKNENEETSK
jgi:hypothetical protein